MLSYYACLSGAEKHAMEAAGQVSEETLRTLALALDKEDMAHVPVRDVDTQTEPDQTVKSHSLQSLLDATMHLHNQRIAYEQQWLRTSEYQRSVEKVTIVEVGQDGNWLEAGERQDVTIPEVALHEPADNEMEPTKPRLPSAHTSGREQPFTDQRQWSRRSNFSCDERAASARLSGVSDQGEQRDCMDRHPNWRHG